MSERDVQDSLKFMREKLRKERKAQNMSQLTLSAEADLACNTICRIEKGTAEPGIGNLLRLTDALHIPMSELFPQKKKGMARIWFWSKITINGMKEMAISTFAS